VTSSLLTVARGRTPGRRKIRVNAPSAAKRPSQIEAAPAGSRFLSVLTRQLPIRSAAVLAAVGLAVGCLAGCSNSDSSRDSTAPKPVTTSASGKQTPPSTGATAVATKIPTKVANDIELRKDVQLSSCKRIEGGWGASGTATNPGTKPVDYTITIFFTTTKATVVSTGATDITVDPGDEQHWSVNKRFAANPKMLCVLRGVA